VNERFPRGVSVDPIIDLQVKRLVQVAVDLQRNKGTLLRSKIGPCYKDRGHLITDRVVNPCQIIQPNFTLALKNLVNKITP
jgi:hypothetical protein